ncbi:hypothetical protein [Bacillus sp. 03113]|uniref:hypothetical protein n=1 Tax=Bacillus sp. 03113 TaxID=2578211 RepID=UPI0015E8CF56|nr:hypothetical protein [Bacillus sp. 03113]
MNIYTDFFNKSLTIIDLKEQIITDEYLYQHSLNVGLIASKIGQIMGLKKENNFYWPV